MTRQIRRKEILLNTTQLQGEILMRIGTLARMTTRILCVALLGMLALTSARAKLTDYTFTATTGDAYDMAGSNVIYPANYDDYESVTVSMGFNFRYNGTNYNAFGAGTNGYIHLGGTSSQYLSACQTQTTGRPRLMLMHYDLVTINLGMRYKLFGNPGSYVMVVEWDCRQYSNSAATVKMQLRMYEGTNNYEYWYGASTSGMQGYIGGNANSSSDYFGITNTSSTSPTWGTSVSCTSSPPPATGTMYLFEPCKTSISGDPAQGGTYYMYQNDSLLYNVVVERGLSTSRKPFTLVSSGSLCASGTFYYTISGPAAADYSISPSTATTFPSNPTITFTPQGSGVRNAYLTVSNNVDYTRSYRLAAVGTPRIQFVGDPQQGGTNPITNGTMLMSNIRIPRLSTGTYAPFYVQHIGTSGTIGISYSMRGSSFGQYSVSTPPATITSGQSSPPVMITFSPTGVGVIADTLVVVADGDTYLFPLAAFSEAAGASFTINGTALDTNSLLFVNQYGCVGEGSVTLPMLVTNIGSLPFYVYGVEGYVTDTTYRQGVPRYPMLRDNGGELIPAGDYTVTLVPPGPGVAPTTYPILVPVGQAMTLYVNFAPTYVGKRFARVFIRTNDEVRVGPDTNDVLAQGLLRFDAFGRGTGAMLSDNPVGGLPQSLVFDKTALGLSHDKWLILENPGTCDLRINEQKLGITAGDVEEFSVVGVSQTWPRDNAGGLVLGAAGRDSIQVRFSPRHIGSRRATLRLETNDSTVLTPGMTERGVYYMDLYGEGKDGLYVNGTEFGLTELNTTASGRSVTLRNAADIPFVITTATIVGVDALEFSEDASNPWPARPFAIVPGQIMELSVAFAPTGTVSGPRSAELELITDRDDTLRATLTGEAGSKSVTGPPSLNFGSLGVGGETRQTLNIANAGSMPVRITDPVLSGPNAAEYTVSPLTRHRLLVGETEAIEVTWRPTAAGPSSATLTIGAEGGDIVLALSGSAVKSKFVGDDPTGTIGSNDGGSLITPGGQTPTGTSSVDAVTRGLGVTLWQTVPNPARDRTDVRFALERPSTVDFGLYDEAGRLVRTLATGMRASGEHRIAVDLTGLPSGVYRYRLAVGDQILVRSLTVVR